MKPGNKPDRFTAKAHAEGYPARSVYKLEEIDRRCNTLVRQGMRVLDLGAAPGSWTRYVANKVGPRGKVVALDLNPLKVATPPYVTRLELDIFKTPVGEMAALGPFDLVLSDMAPHTSGMKEADAWRSVELVERAAEIAEAALVPGGAFVAKIFQGVGFEEIRNRLRLQYGTLRLLKPEASRRESVEIFLVGLSKKGPVASLPSAAPAVEATAPGATKAPE
ncbi:MAG: RlmE family RNA methyltransferase [Myxococcales bacterium]|nr:RlmE family RNA methyltransferase [Myxococcales bacterium]